MDTSNDIINAFGSMGSGYKSGMVIKALYYLLKNRESEVGPFIPKSSDKSKVIDILKQQINRIPQETKDKLTKMDYLSIEKYFRQNNYIDKVMEFLMKQKLLLENNMEIENVKKFEEWLIISEDMGSGDVPACSCGKKKKKKKSKLQPDKWTKWEDVK